MKIKKILKTVNHKIGYRVEHQLIDGAEYGCDDFESVSAFTTTGLYIGNSRWAYRLYRKWGIEPELKSPNSSVCSIGFCKKDQKWFGWSHRAIYGFGVGDVVKEGDCTASSGYTDEYLKDHPDEDRSLPVGFKAKNLDDCRRMAIAFADSVS